MITLTIGQIVKWLVSLFILILLMVPAFISYRGLVMVCYAPFLEDMAFEARRFYHPEDAEPPIEKPLVDSLRRPLKMTLLTLSVSIVVMVMVFYLDSFQ